jgi:hypothetical protein
VGVAVVVAAKVFNFTEFAGKAVWADASAVFASTIFADNTATFVKVFAVIAAITVVITLTDTSVLVADAIVITDHTTTFVFNLTEFTGEAHVTSALTSTWPTETVVVTFVAAAQVLHLALVT